MNALENNRSDGKKFEPPDAPASLLPSLSAESVYRAGDIGVYHAQESPGSCEPHAHRETQIMITFARASYSALWETELGGRRQEQFGGAGVNIVPSGQTHGFNWRKEDRLLSVYLAPDFVTRLAAELGASAQEIQSQWGTQNPLIQQIGHDLWQEFQQDAAPNPLYVELMVTALAAHLLHKQPDAPVSPHHAGGLSPYKLRRVQDYIQAHFCHDLSLLEMAREVHLERHHFAHAFKQSTGVSPYEFVLHCRIERAIELLVSTHLPIGDIACAVGFHDSGQFSRHFKRIVGVTPRQRRDQSI